MYKNPAKHERTSLVDTYPPFYFVCVVLYERTSFLLSPLHHICQTYAFEWGWLEHWIKFGIFGIPVMFWILISLGRRLWKSDEPLWMRAGAVSSLIALGTLHLFTPYLNHPLGFLYIFVGEGIVVLTDSGNRKPPTHGASLAPAYGWRKYRG